MERTREEIAATVREHRDAGYHSSWLTDGVGMEPLTTLAVVGRMVDGIELGTAVVRTLPRHPMLMGEQALHGQRDDRWAPGARDRAVATNRQWSRPGPAFERPVPAICGITSRC